MSRLASVLFFCVVTSLSTAAAAQPRSVLVLPWSDGETDVAMLAARAEAVTRALSSGELRALAPDEARAHFEASVSAEPPSMSDGEVDHWLALSRLAVRHLAQSDYAAARASLVEAQQISEHALAELSRDEARARQVLDTCLYGVRALVETHDAHAPTRALECRRLVPRVAPSPYNHTPEVIELLAAVDRELAGASPGSLRLESRPSGCAVRLNGVVLGQTPFVSADLAAGEYRVQIECEPGTRGRVHRVLIGSEPSAVRIDARFDRAVRTDATLRLAYATRAEADRRRLGDASSVAAAVGAEEVWLLSLEAADVLRLDRVLVASRTPVASIRVHALSGLAAAVASLGRGLSEDRTAPEVVALARWRGEETEDADAHPPTPAWGRADWEVGLGAALGIASVASFGVSLALAEGGSRLGLTSAALPLSDPGYLRSRDAWQNERAAGWAFGISGGVLGTLGVILAMEDEREPPWWSWVIGGAGLVGAVTGLALIGSGDACGSQRPTPTCVAGSQRVDFGVSALGLSLPLLAVPFVFLVRSATDARVSPSIDVTRSSAMLEVAGTW